MSRTLHTKDRIINGIFENTARITALSVLLILGAIFVVLFKDALPAMEHFGSSFLFSTDYVPNREIFSGAVSITGTILTTIIAMVIAVPIAIGIAIYLTEISPGFLKSPIGAMIELLAAIPSIVYGMWGLFYFAPVVRNDIAPFLNATFGHLPLLGGFFTGDSNGIGLLTGSIILAIMVIPFMASITRDAMNTTPDILKESAYGLGGTKWEVIKDVVIPYAKVGIIGSVILSLGRAMGETMAVTFVLGNTHNFPSTIFEPTTSIPVTLANEFNEADPGLYYSSLVYLALILFTMSFITIAVAKFFFLKRKRYA